MRSTIELALPENAEVGEDGHLRVWYEDRA